MFTKNYENAAIREANPLPELVREDGHNLRQVGSNLVGLCPFHEETKPSFNIWQEGRFKCFGCGVHGDVFDYVKLREGVSFFLAKCILASRAGILPVGPAKAASTPRREKKRDVEKRVAVSLPKDCHRLTDDEAKLIAHQRRLSLEAVHYASEHDLLRCGTVCGFPSWLLTDDSGRIAEARRMDGRFYPEIVGYLDERKAHTLKGSSKRWPCGLAPAVLDIRTFRAFLLTEGGPDFLGGLHFRIERQAQDVWPIALLGAGARNIDPAALEILRGRRIRIYPHADSAGIGAAASWAARLQSVGCEVDAFDCTGIIRADGKPCKDLNDLAWAAPESRAELEDLLP